MSRLLDELISFVTSYVKNRSGCSKSELTKAVVSRFELQGDRSVYHGTEYAIRFSKAKGSKGKSIPGTIVGLRKIQKYDDMPFIICILRDDGVEFLLANSTFIKKVSHSSQKFELNKIRGSINGSDILRVFDDISNTPGNFDVLFDIHRQFSFEENLLRLVDQTKAITPIGQAFIPSKEQENNILNSPKIAQTLSNHREYLDIFNELNSLIEEKRNILLEAAKIDNVNLRGNKIEQIITQAGNFHNLADISRDLVIGPKVKIDVKTKILTLASSPKGYNIDKMLKELSGGNTVFSFFFIGIDVEENDIRTCLVSIFDKTILDSTRIQPHWAGRNSRGVTQLTKEFLSVFIPSFKEDIDLVKATKFLKKMIDLVASSPE